MELTVLAIYLSAFILLITFKLLSQKIHPRHLNLPPTLPSLPIIGHLHLLNQPLHQTLNKLSQTLGPIFSLRFGSQLVVVVSTPAAAKECFTKNDIVLANRPKSTPGQYIGYNYTTVVTSPYSEHWRNLRRLMSQEIFSTNRLNIFLSIWQDEIKNLIRQLYQKSSTSFATVEMRSKFTGLTLNIIMRMIARKWYYGDDLENSAEAEQFLEIANEVLLCADASNPSDFLPVLRWIDYQGFEKKLAKIHKRMDTLLQRLIDESRREKRTNTMIHHLLSLQEKQPEYYTDSIIKGLMSVLIVAGTDTTSVTMEWAMSLLVNHVKVMQKARVELDTQIGQDRLINENDLSKLPYLQAIISETFRLCPAAPLLIPHMSSDDCTILEYNVPRETIVLVNAWAIHRDPKVWDDPTSFRPERFVGREAEGHELLPFGVGRRACPGAGLAHRVVGLALGSLIQCFEWKRMDDKLVDMTEGIGLSMPKAEALEAMGKARDTMKKVLSDLATNG